MSVDNLQNKIRKKKNAVMLELHVLPSELPPHLLGEAVDVIATMGQYYEQLLHGLKDLIPAIRFGFASFSVLGAPGVALLSRLLKLAGNLGYYVALDAPELLSLKSAAAVAASFLGPDSLYPCDGLIIGGYPGSDVIKPFLPYCREGKKDIFVVVRTANKSAPELQDLLSGSRLVHAAAADHVNRYGEDTVGKFGYTRVGILAAASASDSLRNLRGKYPKLFMLLDGLDYPGSSFPKCVPAFDQYGHGAVICVGDSVTCAWKQAESDGVDFVEQAQRSAERMKKNLSRYITIL